MRKLKNKSSKKKSIKVANPEIFKNANASLARVVIYEIMNKEFLSIEEQFSIHLTEVSIKYQNLAVGLGMKIDSRKLSKALEDIKHQFSLKVSPLDFLNLVDMSFNRLQLKYVESLVGSHKGQRRVLKVMYIHALQSIFLKFKSTFGSNSNFAFETFVKNEVYPNKIVSNFLKTGKEKQPKGKNVDPIENDPEVKFEKFYKALLKSLDRNR